MTPSLLCSLQENMWTLINTQPLLLLFLLLRPLLCRKTDYSDILDENEEDFEDYLEELFAVGPTKPPTKELFKSRVLISDDRPLTDTYYCTDEIKMKNVHNRLFCVKEHFFLVASYESIREFCFNSFVPCKNNVRKCHRSKKVIEAVRCLLVQGTRMPACEYTSTYKKGFVLLTCQWENEIGDIIPNHVNEARRNRLTDSALRCGFRQVTQFSTF
uniref:Inactive ribonuclease-like protein 9 n=1 Tax=Catagonus wagneri TaxID=51154 RepID=A0A8C3W5E9_9CETA